MKMEYKGESDYLRGIYKMPFQKNDLILLENHFWGGGTRLLIKLWSLLLLTIYHSQSVDLEGLIKHLTDANHTFQ